MWSLAYIIKNKHKFVDKKEQFIGINFEVVHVDA